MLLRTGRMQEPSVVCHVNEEARASEHKFSCQLANSIFETDQGRDLRVLIR